MIDKITIRRGRAHNVGSIHVINVLRILSSRNMKYLPSSYSLPFSLILLVLLTPRNRRRLAVCACKLCSGRAISATTSISTGESTEVSATRSSKNATENSLAFQRANRAHSSRVESNRLI